MTDKLETIDVRSKRLLDLHDRLKAREGKAGFEENCKALKLEIAKLEKRSQKFDL